MSAFIRSSGALIVCEAGADCAHHRPPHVDRITAAIAKTIGRFISHPSVKQFASRKRDCTRSPSGFSTHYTPSLAWRVYTCVMLRALLVALLVAIASRPSLPASQEAESGPLPLGVVIPRVVATKDPQQTYALYLPKDYSRKNRWPVVYVFDPLARGKLALRQFEPAAELYGFVVAASNNSRNGPWTPQIEAAQAMVNDTQQRLTIDAKRIYFAGFSGGARVAAQLALLCKCAAGVLLGGAGFPLNAPPSAEAKFAVFSAVGNADFHFREVSSLQDQLEKAARPHWLRVFDGPHEWAPANVMDEALAWFRVQAMKANLESHKAEFIASQLTAARQRAEP